MQGLSICASNPSLRQAVAVILHHLLSFANLQQTFYIKKFFY